MSSSENTDSIDKSSGTYTSIILYFNNRLVPSRTYCLLLNVIGQDDVTFIKNAMPKKVNQTKVKNTRPYLRDKSAPKPPTSGN
jgi:hypothetical protein